MTQPAADPLAPLLELPGVRDAVGAARTAIDEVYRHPANRWGWPATAAAFATSHRDALGAWIVHCCDALVAGAREARSIADCLDEGTS